MEAVLLIPILLASTTFLLDICRRRALEVVLQRVACQRVRDSLFHSPQIEANTRAFLVRALGEDWGKQVKTKAEFLELTARSPAKARVFYRYPQFYAFSYRPRNKSERRSHHDEITKECFYPFS